jgi:Tol biopolymer transport system component
MPKSAALCLLLLIALAACQQEEAALPTQIDLAALAADETSTAAAAPTGVRPTLPPTHTHTPPPTPTPSDVPSTPENFNGAGTIFFIYNDDSIIKLAGDGSREELIITFGVDQPITNLTLAPDGSLLAFVAPGSGSAREVYVASRDGAYIQQVSCLGFADVAALTWTPDSQTLTFVAAQSSGGPRDIYSADWIGSDTCPQGNNQRQILNLSSPALTDLTYNAAGDILYFSDNGIHALDLATGQVSAPITQGSALGSDYDLTFNPSNPNLLVYLRPTRLENQTGGQAILLDVDTTTIRPVPQFEGVTLIQQLDWSPDASLLLLSGLQDILLYNIETRAQNRISGSLFPPQAVFSPDGQRIVYIGADPASAHLQQLFVVDTEGVNARQITFHEEGTMNNLIWTSSQP